MKRILDRLMLSTLSEANDPFFLQTHEVQAIMYFGDGGMFPEDIKLYYRPSLKDGTLDPTMLKDGVLFLQESLRAGRRVLAVGESGSTIVMAYLAEMGMSFDQAAELVGGRNIPKPDASRLNDHMDELNRRSSTTLGHK